MISDYNAVAAARSAEMRGASHICHAGKRFVCRLYAAGRNVSVCDQTGNLSAPCGSKLSGCKDYIRHRIRVGCTFYPIHNHGSHRKLAFMALISRLTLNQGCEQDVYKRQAVHGTVCLEAGKLVDVFSPKREEFLKN